MPWPLGYVTWLWQLYTVPKYIMQECVCSTHIHQGRRLNDNGMTCIIAWVWVEYVTWPVVVILYCVGFVFIFRRVQSLHSWWTQFGNPQDRAPPRRFLSHAPPAHSAVGIPLPINRPLPLDGGPSWAVRSYRHNLQPEAKARGIRANRRAADLARMLTEDDKERWGERAPIVGGWDEDRGGWGSGNVPDSPYV